MKVRLADSPPVADAPAHRPWQWSIDEAWTWLSHTWGAVLHMPYLGLLSLVVAALLVLTVFAKVLGTR